MDAKLPWHCRLAVRLHLLYCVWCRRYAAQIQFLRRASRELAAEALAAPAQTLSGEAKQQMGARLREALKDPPSTHQ
jgi:hypothetical protein